MVILGECITTTNTKVQAWLHELYQRGPLIAKFTITVLQIIRQDVIRSARTKESKASLPFEGTFVVNANGDFAVHFFDGIEKLLQQIQCKFNTSNNSTWSN